MMSDAKLLVDFNGNGHLQEVFHPTLQISYITGEVPVPEIVANNDGFAQFDFTVNVDNPFLYVTPVQNVHYNDVGADTYFVHLGGRNWRLMLVGRASSVNNGGFINTVRGWRIPMVGAGETKIYYGGYRG